MTLQPKRPTVFSFLAGVALFGIALMSVSSAHAQVAISEDGVTFPDNSEPVWAVKQYGIGDRGPAGGWVFYVTADGLHGLEAAPADQSTGAEWGCWGTDVPGAESAVRGTGASNTEAILQGCPAAGIAARLAAEYESPSGYIDWHLPSRDELHLMYDNIGPGAASQNMNVGGFADGFYWSSSEDSDLDAWNQNFANGNQNGGDKSILRRVRAARAF